MSKCAPIYDVFGFYQPPQPQRSKMIMPMLSRKTFAANTIEVNFCVGCMVSHPNRLLQRSTTMSLINKIKNEFSEQGRTGNKQRNPAMKSGFILLQGKTGSLTE